MTYYLIASSDIPDFKYRATDYIVLFNYSRHIERFKEHRRNILIVNFHNFRWQYLDKFKDICPYCRKVLICYPDKEKGLTDFGFNADIGFPYTKFNIHYFFDKMKDYPPRKTPSSGFLVYSLLYQRRKVVLVGFTGSGWRGHAWEYEQSVYKKNGVKMI